MAPKRPIATVAKQNNLFYLKTLIYRRGVFPRRRPNAPMWASIIGLTILCVYWFRRWPCACDLSVWSCVSRRSTYGKWKTGGDTRLCATIDYYVPNVLREASHKSLDLMEYVNLRLAKLPR